MAKSFTNVWTYGVVIFIFALFMIILNNYGSFLQGQDEQGIIDLPVLNDFNAKLNNNSINLNATETEIEDPVSYKYNTTEGTPKDFSIPFLFSQEKSSGIRKKIQFVYTIPTSFIGIFVLPAEEFKSIIDLLFWLIAFAIFIAMIYFIRAVIT